jgi:hypothetical protein
MKSMELGPEERAVIAAARDAHGPSEMQRARVRKALDAKLAAGIAAPILATSTALATTLKVGVGIAMVATLGGGAVYVTTHRPTDRPPPATHAARPAKPAPTPPAGAPPGLEDQPSAAAPVAESLRPPSHPRGSAHRHETSPPAPADLSGELGLLTQANAAIQQGEVARADQLLRAYDRRYPAGQLAQERAAAGILIDCATGRVPTARAAARRFLERWPRSPLVPRIQSSCALWDPGP